MTTRYCLRCETDDHWGLHCPVSGEPTPPPSSHGLPDHIRKFARAMEEGESALLAVGNASNTVQLLKALKDTVIDLSIQLCEPEPAGRIADTTADIALLAMHLVIGVRKSQS